MRILPAAASLLLLMGSSLAQAEIIKPTDFQPLTSLPWKAPNATLEGVLNAIYHEPDPRIRYPVLSSYLNTIPAGQLGTAFDRCVTLEGVPTPDDLVYFFLEIWAARDPVACWKKTQHLFHLVGIEESWLDYDTWQERITVRDLDAIRASPFWLSSSALTSFPLGVENSSLPNKERVRIMKAFASQWFEDFGTWPAKPSSEPVRFLNDDPQLMHVFSGPPVELSRCTMVDTNPGPGMSGLFINRGQEAKFDMEARRWLEAEPASAPQIIKTMEKLQWEYEKDNYLYSYSDLLLLWSKVDQAGMIQWADAGDMKNDGAVFEARALLMGRVDAATRGRWLAQARAPKLYDDRTADLIAQWAGWDPAPALSAAVASATSNWEIVILVARGAADGPDGIWVQSACHFGFEAIKDFDIGKVPPKDRQSVTDEWEDVMEIWGDIDVGEAARYGIDFLNRTHYPRRDAMIRYFSGENVDIDDMVTHSMSALRVWAVVRPEEMKAWIATLNDPRLEKALTWLLNHPWGGSG
jgi:hypothetical protein